MAIVFYNSLTSKQSIYISVSTWDACVKHCDGVQEAVAGKNIDPSVASAPGHHLATERKKGRPFYFFNRLLVTLNPKSLLSARETRRTRRKASNERSSEAKLRLLLRSEESLLLPLPATAPIAILVRWCTATIPGGLGRSVSLLDGVCRLGCCVGLRFVVAIRQIVKERPIELCWSASRGRCLIIESGGGFCLWVDRLRERESCAWSWWWSIQGCCCWESAGWS